jgi:ribonuclease HII
VASNFYHANSEFNTSQNNLDYYLGKLDSKDLSAKDRDDYKKKLSDLRSNSSQVRSRYQDALRIWNALKLSMISISFKQSHKQLLTSDFEHCFGISYSNKKASHHCEASP